MQKQGFLNSAFYVGLGAMKMHLRAQNTRLNGSTLGVPD